MYIYAKVVYNVYNVVDRLWFIETIIGHTMQLCNSLQCGSILTDDMGAPKTAKTYNIIRLNSKLFSSDTINNNVLVIVKWPESSD